jgi:hypothetical protein
MILSEWLEKWAIFHLTFFQGTGPRRKQDKSQAPKDPTHRRNFTPIVNVFCANNKNSRKNKHSGK